MTPPPGIEAIPNGQWVVAGDTHFRPWSLEHGHIMTDPYLYEWLEPYLKGVITAWDLGANIGSHTRKYLDWGIKVTAIEPHPLAFECLEHNCPEAMNICLAASDEDGEVRFSAFDNVGASRVSKTGALTVQARRLDGLHLQKPDYVKLDCEGHEVFALLGMMESLRKSRPIGFCEVNADALAVNGHSRFDIRNIFRDLGYQEPIIYPPYVSDEDPQYDLLFLP